MASLITVLPQVIYLYRTCIMLVRVLRVQYSTVRVLEGIHLPNGRGTPHSVLSLRKITYSVMCLRDVPYFKVWSSKCASISANIWDASLAGRQGRLEPSL